MVDFLEAVVLLLPSDAGGRPHPIAPRAGSYRVRAGSMQVRFIEGPPAIAPGQAARVVVELESEVDSQLHPGSDLELIEDNRVIGILTITRVLRSAVAV